VFASVKIVQADTTDNRATSDREKEKKKKGKKEKKSGERKPHQTRFPWQPHPRRTQCGVGADEPFVTEAECATTRIPDAPLP
jgi:hypothetical protein